MAAHKCQFCGKGFSKLDHHNRHRRSHTLEKPYKCSVCNKNFARSDVLFRHMRFHAREARVQREIGYRSDHREVCPVWEPKPHLRDESGSMTSPWSSGSSSVQLSLTGDPVYAQKRPVLPCWSGAYVNQVVTLDRPCTKQAYPPTTGIHWLRDNVTSTANLHNRLQGLLSQYFGDLDASAIFIQDCDKSQRDTESVAEDYQYPLNYGQRPWPQYE